MTYYEDELNNNLIDCLVGIDKKDLCSKCGISRQYLYDLINCKCSPSLVVARRISLYITCNTTYFFNYTSSEMFIRIWL